MFITDILGSGVLTLQQEGWHYNVATVKCLITSKLIGPDTEQVLVEIHQDLYTYTRVQAMCYVLKTRATTITT